MPTKVRFPTPEEVDAAGLEDRRVLSVVNKAANKQTFIKGFKSEGDQKMDRDQIVAMILAAKADKDIEEIGRAHV